MSNDDGQLLEQQEVLEVGARLTAAWAAERREDLAACLAADMVLVVPGFRDRVTGRAACLETWRQFMEQPEVRDCRESGHTADVFRNTAVVSCAFEMVYVMGGGEHREQGRDLLVPARREEGWRVVWRTLSCGAQES